MSTQADAYAVLAARARSISTARQIEALLDWDQETQMPPAAAEDRANQLALIAGIAHEQLAADETGALLARAEQRGDLSDDARANVRDIRRDYDRAVRIPRALVEDIARSTTLAKAAWVEARKRSDYAAFSPHLTRLVELKRELADRVGWNSEPYDALMDEYEPGARSSAVQEVFDRLKAELTPLVAAIAGAKRQPDLGVLHRPAPIAQQAAFNESLVRAMGFDLRAGRIDTAAHPFCSGVTPMDVRLTNRYDESHLPTSLFGILHECGHGLYEQGFDPAHTGTALARAISLGIHESQSRMWENLVGRGMPFWRCFFPKLQATVPSYRDVPIEDWHFAINAVRPSFIRVEADEVTYALHIILRFDLERRLIRGELAVRDVPDAWNGGMRTLLGITPPNDAQGCLQDIHWSMGIFGYFPTYALGNLYAAQFFEQVRREIPDLDDQFARGELLPLREWLRERIHRPGRTFSADELVHRVTGRPLSHQPFVAYVRGKFTQLYGL